MSSSSQPFRRPDGGLVDRDKTLSFSFDGRKYRGHAGDTLASALLANGVRLVGRSFKYHRPRGILSAGSEEPNALVELRAGARREPNSRATVTELFDGLDAVSQNRWPSLKHDLQAVNGLVSPFLTAGFYYKTFMWPPALWEKLYEPIIRRAAGLGRASGVDDPDRYERATAFCDVLVIGSGAAGLAAALGAARAGARVILCEEDFRLGGRCLSETRAIGGAPAGDWVTAVEDELAALKDVRVFRRTAVFGAYDDGTYGAIERVNDHLPVPPDFEPRQRLWRIVAKRAVLAAGAIERPIVFAGNDRPGVMLAGAVRGYVNRYAALPGKRAVVFCNNDDAARTVGDLRAAHVDVVGLIDAREHPPQAVAELAAAAGVELYEGAVITNIRGGKRVKTADIRFANGGTAHLDCDLVAVSGGWNPAIHLASHRDARGRWNDDLAAFLAEKAPPGMAICGAAAGEMTLAAALGTGAEAGSAAAADCGFKARVPDCPKAEDEPAAVSAFWQVPHDRGKAFVDFQNDVTDKDVALAEREGYRSVEHLKRYTTLGMATDQGKTANVTGLAILAGASGRTIPQTGTTRFRPPFVPVSIGALAGHSRGKHFQPYRLPPSHDWATEQGAVFVEAGLWLRAQYFPRHGDTGWLDAMTREVLATRNGVGVCDVSTLGKIDLQGADCAEFLNRLYTNGWKTLPVGKARYGLMLREDGLVMDDGTTARLAEDRYIMTTTTANAAGVLRHMEFCHQCLWPDLDVTMVSVSEQWAQFAVAGPKARAVLQRIVDPAHDISNDAFPYLAAGELTACGGIRARLFRISFSGELAYEIAVPARYGDALIRRIMEAGREFDIAPYGTEALSAMRIEKGHVAGGELNGQTTARDMGLGAMMSTKKDYIGRELAERPAFVEADRPAFVGVKPLDTAEKLAAGAHFIAVGADASLETDEGHLSSVAYSPMLGHWIGLGFIKNGPERIGERIRAVDPVRGKDIEVEICSPVFFDPEGERLRV